MQEGVVIKEINSGHINCYTIRNHMGGFILTFPRTHLCPIEEVRVENGEAVLEYREIIDILCNEPESEGESARERIFASTADAKAHANKIGVTSECKQL